MRKPNTLLVAVIGALGLHAIVLLFGGVLTPSAQEQTEKKDTPEKGTPKRPPVQRVQLASRKDAKPPEQAPASDAPKPTPEAPKTEPRKTEVAAQTTPQPEPTRTEAPSPTPQEPPVQQVAQPAEEPAAPPPLPKLPEPPQAKPATPAPSRPAPATPAAVVEAGPAAIAAPQASDAQVESALPAGGDGQPVGAPAPQPVKPQVPTARATPPAPEVASMTLAQAPAATPPMPPQEPAAALEPRSPALRLGGITAPRRLGPAWKAAADAIGPVPATTPAPAASVRPSARRAREIPPVDLNATAHRTPVAYKPLKMPRELQGDANGMATLTAAAAAVTSPAAPTAASPQNPPAQAPVAPVAPATNGGSGRGLGQGPGAGGNAALSTVRNAAGGTPADRGRLAPGASVPQDPVARIAWGSADDALRTLDAARMQVVMVDADLKIVGGVDRSGATWARTASPAQLAAYSNRVRVVDHVEGFAQYGSLCGPGEHLAVIVPIGLDRRIERAMDEAARREGLTRQQVAACYGRLVTQPTGVEFQIERVERRNLP